MRDERVVLFFTHILHSSPGDSHQGVVVVAKDLLEPRVQRRVLVHVRLICRRWWIEDITGDIS